MNLNKLKIWVEVVFALIALIVLSTLWILDENEKSENLENCSILCERPREFYYDEDNGYCFCEKDKVYEIIKIYSKE